MVPHRWFPRPKIICGPSPFTEGKKTIWQKIHRRSFLTRKTTGRKKSEVACKVVQRTSKDFLCRSCFFVLKARFISAVQPQGRGYNAEHILARSGRPYRKVFTLACRSFFFGGFSASRKWFLPETVNLLAAVIDIQILNPVESLHLG